MPIDHIRYYEVFVDINLNYRVFSLRALSFWYLFIFASFLFLLAQPFKSCCLLRRVA